MTLEAALNELDNYTALKLELDRVEAARSRYQEQIKTKRAIEDLANLININN